jgi:cytochrome o ubiquinol oxidase operon protein cyoD
MEYKSSAYQIYMKYLVGFTLSVLITFGSYFLVANKLADGYMLLIMLFILAFSQLFVQLLFFLHLGEEKKPRLRVQAFTFMFIILVIIVGGSIWVMHHLNYNMMNFTSEQKEHYMMIQRDKGF